MFSAGVVTIAGLVDMIRKKMERKHEVDKFAF